MPDRALLLDTCALVWLTTDAPQLSSSARSAIDAADMVYVSAISAWELSLKASHGALELPAPPGEWFSRALDQHHLSLVDLTVDILVASNALPRHHRDPADRFIIATAHHLNATVVTADHRFNLYDVNLIV